MAKVIGLDIGGTKINGVLYDGKKILHELSIVTPKNLYDFEKHVLKLADFLSAQDRAAGVGIGIAGLVDSAKGMVVRSPNMQFIQNLNLVKFFQKNGYKNVKVDNDANCFTRYEQLKGLGTKHKNFIALTLGTGIGGGIVTGGQIYRGAKNAGAELGHIVVNGQYLEDLFKPARDSRNNVALGKILGQAFASFANIFAPEAIILGGGVATDKTRNFIPLINKEMRKFLFDHKSPVKILVSKQKKAGALGAALQVL